MMSEKDKLKPYLGQIEKPQRYLGEELHQIEKEWEVISCRFLFCFPDVYEVGMSHLGMHILYEAVNSRKDMLMERAFSPWPDMEALMLRLGVSLYGLESGRPAVDYDCLGFTLQHEMSYTNVLQMLALAGIPFYAKDRGGAWPLILAGGPCCANGEPVADFFDAMLLGDGEEALPALLEAVIQHKMLHQGAVDKASLLEELSALPGIYIPSMYAQADKVEDEWDPGEWVRDMGPELIQRKPDRAKRIESVRLADLEEGVFPLKPMVPYMEIIHDRMMLEILRGCTRGCRFCQAGMIYRPVRERKRETLLAQAKMLRDATGYNEISLTSLSSSDHSCIEGIIEDLTDAFRDERISISLPSLRANHFSVNLAQKVQAVRRSGLTFAPEAGSQRMRDVINKGVQEEEFLSTIEKAVAAGWNRIKLYFMIGLPGETMEDVDGIATLCEKVLITGNRVMKELGLHGTLRLNCAVSNFVPKAQTPFQWVGQSSQAQLSEKHMRLKQKIKDRRISLSYHDAFTSALEAVFARGGRELAAVLVSAWEKGCRFDSWSEWLKQDSWLEAFQAHGIDLVETATKSYDLESPLPWDHLSFGVTKEFLKAEYRKSQQAILSADCRYRSCSSCGVCSVSGYQNRLQGEAVDQ